MSTTLKQIEDLNARIDAINKVAQEREFEKRVLSEKIDELRGELFNNDLGFKSLSDVQNWIEKTETEINLSIASTLKTVEELEAKIKQGY